MRRGIQDGVFKNKTHTEINVKNNYTAGHNIYFGHHNIYFGHGTIILVNLEIYIFNFQSVPKRKTSTLSQHVCQTLALIYFFGFLKLHLRQQSV